MKPAFTALPCALILTLAPLSPTFANVVDDCRQMAKDEAVPAEDMEDYMAECVAAGESESPDEGAPVDDSGEAAEVPDRPSR